MKKLLALLLVSVMCFSLSACDNREDIQKNSEKTIELSADEKLLLGDWKAYAIIYSSSNSRYLSEDEYGELRLYDDLTGILAAEVDNTRLRESITWNYLDDDIYDTSYKLMSYVDGELWLVFEEIGTYLVFKRQ
jgi:hypothetical protein